MDKSQKKLWFKSKSYGWGWYPVTWQGWIITLVYIVFLAYIFTVSDLDSHSVSDTLISVSVPFILSSSLLIWICYKKGEKPTWRWGKD
jgi:hypothetical protein